MYNVIEIINLHENVNINTFFDNIIKKTLQMILHVLRMKKNCNELIKIFCICVLIELKFKHI